MGFHVFTEKEINKALLNKLPFEGRNGTSRAGHKIVWVNIDGIRIEHVKIPNPHNKEFRGGKAKELAKKLKLDNEEYKKFIECTLKEKEYVQIIKKKLGLK